MQSSSNYNFPLCLYLSAAVLEVLVGAAGFPTIMALQIVQGWSFSFEAQMGS